MKKVILFAGCPESGKTPIAYWLSQNLGLAIWSNDAVRTEVSEDYGWFLSSEDGRARYFSLRDERCGKLLESGKDFVLDASVDRTWTEKKKLLEQHGYEWLIISLDLSQEKLEHLYVETRYDAGLGEGWTAQLKSWIEDHAKFLEKHGAEVGLHIDDDNFRDRLRLSLEKVEEFVRGARQRDKVV